MRILGVETSADDTGIALIEAVKNDADVSFTICGNALLSQTELHTAYGGIFPNLAKREHGRNLTPVLMECLRQAGEVNPGKTDESTIGEIEKILSRESELFTYLAAFLRMNGKPNIDCIAVTAGPGLEPALWVGINFAKALSLAWNIPIVAVNHLEGHIMIAALKSCKKNDDSESQISNNSTHESLTLGSRESDSRAIALLVSGGHTELILMREFMNYELIGRTRDDAAGEAFDKTARLLGLPYPGGPEISRLAAAARAAKLPRGAILPRPMLTDPSYDFSFSGLKTAVRNTIATWSVQTPELQLSLAREIEEAIIEVLVAKTKRAAKEFGARTLIVGGGVSANTYLRSQCMHEFQESMSILFPASSFSTDNAVMIALAGYFHAQNNEFADASRLAANGNLSLV